MKPIKKEIMDNVKLIDIVAVTSVLSVGGIDIGIVNYIVSALFILVVIIILYLYFKKYPKLKEDAKNHK